MTLLLLNDNITKLDRIANALIEREKLTGEEFEKVYNGEELEPLTPFEEGIIESENK